MLAALRKETEVPSAGDSSDREDTTQDTSKSKKAKAAVDTDRPSQAEKKTRPAKAKRGAEARNADEEMADAENVASGGGQKRKRTATTGVKKASAPKKVKMEEKEDIRLTDKVNDDETEMTSETRQGEEEQR